MTKKTCRACHLEKPATADYFVRQAAIKSGLSARCKACDRIKRDSQRDIVQRHVAGLG
jgi:hypothetical protein